MGSYYDGNETLVRCWGPALNGGRGGWQVTEKGEVYLRYYQDEYVVDLLILVIRKKENSFAYRDNLPVQRIQDEGWDFISNVSMMLRLTVHSRAASNEEKESYLRVCIHTAINGITNQIFVQTGNQGPYTFGAQASQF